MSQRQKRSNPNTDNDIRGRSRKGLFIIIGAGAAAAGYFFGTGHGRRTGKRIAQGVSWPFRQAGNGAAAGWKMIAGGKQGGAEQTDSDAVRMDKIRQVP